MANGFNRLFGQLGKGLIDGLMAGLGCISHNGYTLTVEGLRSPISVWHVDGDEWLNQPWRYVITSTRYDKAFSIEATLNQKASFSFHSASYQTLMSTISALSNFLSVNDKPSLYEAITVLSPLSLNKVSLNSISSLSQDSLLNLFDEKRLTQILRTDLDDELSLYPTLINLKSQ
ncbi:hypothetical protein [Gilliamella sp. App4-10]|uniref:hypothetical protein n=1 Tax=Gilliamella sp. App4-10 TaxID=3120231 RepID=UPI00080E3DA9|nr:hypothetical protein [Gilliamella apicola]OCG18811.1 hypothetical protein A9G23_10440 [Gilliamella apicola]